MTSGVLDYDDATVSNIANGSISPYAFLMDKINNIEITPAQLALDPCTGSCVITDVKTGQLKALVSYPGYDNNKLANTVDADYYQSLREDKSNPLWNYATREQTARDLPSRWYQAPQVLPRESLILRQRLIVPEYLQKSAISQNAGFIPERMVWTMYLKL